MPDVLRPDGVFVPGDTVERRGWLREAALALPNLIKLLGRLLRDPRVPRRSKALVGLTLGYLLSPVDLLPDAIPVLGQTDDLLLVAFALSHLLRSAGEEVVLEHWDGSRDLLEVIHGSLELGADLLPRPVRRLVGRLTRS